VSVGDRVASADPGVRHDDVQPTELVNGLGNRIRGGLPGRDVPVVRRCPAARGDDLGYHVIRCPAQVVRHHNGTVRGQHQRLGSPDPIAGTGDSGNFAIEKSHADHVPRNRPAIR
jgi:hypothetical protein